MEKVIVSCAGRFHAYDLANQLEKRGLLSQLITTYPKSEIRKFGIPDHKVVSLLYWEILNRGWAKVADAVGINKTHLQNIISESYDRIAPAFISKDADVYIGWSSNSERGLKRAKRNGAVTILERGSAHIKVQTDILNQEYAQFYKGKSPYFTHPRIIEKELREYALADYISVPSLFVKRSFMQMGVPESKLLLNAYGVELSHFNRVNRKDADVFRVIFVGQLSLQKGIHYLLQAFSELKLPKAELLLVGGKNPDIDPYLELYKNSFRYIGSVPQRELQEHYSESDVFILPSLQEGFGMVLLQAMACGLPVISTEHTGGVDVTEEGKTGFVIPIRSVDAIKEKLQWLYNNRDVCREMGMAAQEKVASGFTWDDYGRRYADNITRIVSPNG